MMQVIGEDLRSMVCQGGNGQMPTRHDYRVCLLREMSVVKCYRGMGSQDFVIDYGDKLNLNEAIAHFPFLKSYLEKEGCVYDG